MQTFYIQRLEVSPKYGPTRCMALRHIARVLPGSGTVDFDEFLVMMVRCMKEESKGEIRRGASRTVPHVRQVSFPSE